MKNGKNNDNKTIVNGAVALFIVALIALGCTCGRGSGSAPPEYVGAWRGADGTILTIRADGTGDYKSGGSEVTNGSVEIKDGNLSLTLFGMGKTFKIDEAPKGDRMKLDGVVFTKGDGSGVTGDKDTSSKKDSDDRTDSDKRSSGDMPADSEVNALVKNTTADFADAVENEDFSDFMANTSTEFQAQFTPDRMSQVFSTFLEKKEAAVPILRNAVNSQPQYSPPPKIETKQGKQVLVANGKLPAGNYTVNFEYEYVQNGSDWKLIKIQIKL